MRITNIENWKKEVETTMVETFYIVRTNIQEVVTQKGFIIQEPTIITKDGKDFATIEVSSDGAIIIWDSNYELETILETSAFKTKMSMLCYLTKKIMMMDKYNTMY